MSLGPLVAAREIVKEQIAERDRDFPEQSPAFQWKIATRALSYVLDMSDKNLRSIRLHCDLFLGVSTPNHLFMHWRGTDPRTVDEAYGYRWLGEGVDPASWASEPPVDCLESPLGLPFEGRTISDVICLLQRYACNLVRLGMRPDDHVVEIGAGYGGLAETLLKVRPQMRYTIIDLPETLIYAAAFLQTHFPDRPAYVYRPGDDPDAIDWDGVKLVFLPNYRADWLRRLPRSQSAINTVSFPEMTRAQLCLYRDLLAETLDGLLMSVNYYGAKAEDGGTRGVTDYLAERFVLTPTPEQIISGIGMSESSYREHNCRPTILCAPPGYDLERVRGAQLRDIFLGIRAITAVGESVVRV